METGLVPAPVNGAKLIPTACQKLRPDVKYTQTQATASRRGRHPYQGPVAPWGIYLLRVSIYSSLISVPGGA